MFATHVFLKPRRRFAIVLSCAVPLQDRFRRKRENLLPGAPAPNMIVGSGATVFFAAVLTVHFIRRKISGSVDQKNVMPVSIFFQFLSALQKLEQLRETMPQLPRLDFVEPFARVRRHATDTVQSRSTEPPRQNAQPRRTSEDTSCRTPPSPGNPSDSALGLDLQWGRSKLALPSTTPER